MSRKPKISLCMIVRNEEAFLANCLKSVIGAVDEIVVVDTGSSDSTPRVAADFGARVLSFEWSDDFSEARNYSLENASGDWMLVLDADELIAERDVGRIRTLTNGNTDGYLFTYRSYSQDSHDIRWIANDGSYREGDGWDGWISGQVVRMFRRDDRIRFLGAVHESVDLSIIGFGGRLASTDILIHHFHEKKGKAALRDKQLSYLRMCEKNLEILPGNAKTYFDMGLVYRYMLDDIARAILHQQKAVQLDAHFEDARMELASLYHLSGDSKNAARELGTLLEQNPKLAPALHLCGIMLERRGKVDRAIECYERAIELNPNLIDTRLNLGTLLFRKGEYERARKEWELAHRMNPSNARVLLNLGALELHGGNHGSAQRFFERALERSPESALLWNNLGVLYADTGRTQEAINAFEKALALDSGCEDARRNLEAFLGRAGSSV
ncbi:MAG: tetratricopeptide repeat protein [Candidatus Hydrogenedentota bacterium]|nr:MAG: tetratricopeptide repeat protein [Candidatus Hydrogenedentota bacterium]